MASLRTAAQIKFLFSSFKCSWVKIECGFKCFKKKLLISLIFLNSLCNVEPSLNSMETKPPLIAHTPQQFCNVKSLILIHLRFNNVCDQWDQYRTKGILHMMICMDLLGVLIGMLLNRFTILNFKVFGFSSSSISRWYTSSFCLASPVSSLFLNSQGDFMSHYDARILDV